MLKNIQRKSFILVIVLLSIAVTTFSACMSLQLNPSPENFVDTSVKIISNCGEAAIPEAVPTDTSATADAIDRIAALDAKFEASLDVPHGTTASLLAYAKGLCELWYTEIEILIGEDAGLWAEFSDFSDRISAELAVNAESYRDGENSPYGSAASYELTMKRAMALREWYLHHTKASPEP